MHKHIQIRGVPPRVHAVLRTRAARAGMSLSEFLLAELRAVAAQPALEEILERIAHRESVHPRESPARAVRAGRDAR
jgi:plasmid stability protein